MIGIVTLQLDPIESLHFDTDTSLLLAKEARRRGYQTLFYQPNKLTYKNNELHAETYLLDEKTLETPSNYYKYVGNLNLTESDVILIRQNPPFNINYISYTYLLEKISNQTRLFLQMNVKALR